MTSPSYYPRDLSLIILVPLDQPGPGVSTISGPLPRSNSTSLAAIPKQSNPALSTPLSSQSAVAAAESSSALFLLSAYAAGTIVVIAVVVNNVPSEWRSIGLFRAADEAELREVLASLPLHIWMKVTITPLTPHPNDPEYRARQQM